MNETTEENLTPEEEQPAEEKKSNSGKIQMWVFLVLSFACLCEGLMNIVALMERVESLRIVGIILWLLAAACWGAASLFARNEQKNQA